MSVIEVIQPVCVPRASISGETYSRASNWLPSLLLDPHRMPPGGVSPASSSCRRALQVLEAVGFGPVGKGRRAPDQARTRSSPSSGKTPALT